MSRPVYCNPTRVCRHCGIDKPVAEMRKARYRGERSTEYITSECLICHAEKRSAKRKEDYRARDKESVKARVRAWREKKKADGTLAAYELARALRRHYGLTLDQYEAMWAEQDQKCAICRTPRMDLVRPSVDHCHKTNLVRGLLCARCNNGLGCYGDSPERLRAAADYIESRRQPE